MEFYVKRSIRSNIINFKPENGRMATLRLKVTKNTINIVNIYPSSKTTEPHAKDVFYDTLFKGCEEIPRKDEIIILGDTNAQMSKDTYLREIIGNEK